MERATSEHASGVLTRDHRPTCSDHRHALRRPSLLSYCAHFFCTSLALSFILPPAYVSPPSSHPSSSSSVFIVFASHAMQLLSRFTKREREKKTVSVFIFLSLFFLHKMNKVNIFYYTEQQKVFFFTWLKIRDKNCNKENLLYVLLFFFLLLGLCLEDWLVCDSSSLREK